MRPLIRLWILLRTLAKYRLAELAPKSSVSWPLKLLLWVCGLGANKIDTDDHPRGERLRLALQELGPIYIKFGQIVSTRRDMLAPDIADALALLQDQVAPFDGELAREIVERELGKPIGECFSSFDTTALASASVAQVHTVTLLDGGDAVVKIIRPGIEKTINRDIKLLFFIAKILQRNSIDAKRLRLTELISDYEQVIHGELDLKQEAANSSLLKRNFETDELKGLMYVPEIHWDFSTENILTMERIYGVPVSDIKTLKDKGTNLALLAERGVEIFFTQVFEQNFFHADMHPGNIFIDISDPDDPSYITLDCAIMGTLSHTDRYYVARLLLSALNRDYHTVAKLYVEAGWLDRNVPLASFESVIRSVCEPMFSKPISELAFGSLLVYLFKAARRFGMEVQPSLVLLQKTLVNIEGLGQQLYPQLDLWETAQPFLARWVEENYSPKGASRSLQHQLPELMESLPVLPNRFIAGLQHFLLDSGLGSNNNLQMRLDSLEHQVKRQRKTQFALASIAAIFLLGWLSS